MTFTKRQQEILVHMLNQKGYRLKPNGQEIYKTGSFYNMIKELKECELVKGFKKESDGSSYQLTDKGLFFASIIKDKVDKTLPTNFELIVKLLTIEE